MAAVEVYTRWRYRLLPDHVVGEILSKAWIDNAVPVAILIVVIGVFSALIPNFLAPGSLIPVARQLGEYLFVALGMAIVVKAGGIDLSVGSTFALCNLAALYMTNALGMSVAAVVPSVILLGALVGSLNGFLVGYLRLRAFLTTLVTLIVLRAVVELLSLRYAVVASISPVPTPTWDYMGAGDILFLPMSFVVALAAGILTHVLLTRTRFGWHLSAVGGSRRSSYNVGLPVKRIVFQTYVCSGMYTAVGAVFYAARLDSTGGTVGLGLEILVITAVVLGGNSLGGGRGSAAKAIIGLVIVMLIANGLVRLSLRTGAADLVLGVVLLVAVAIDVKWMKNRYKVLSRAYVSPTYLSLPPNPGTAISSGSPYEVNNRLSDAGSIGLGTLDGPEDVILGDNDDLYCGSRHGDVIRFFGPDHKRQDIYAHIGGHPLGMAFNSDRELVICVAGMGLYKVTKLRKVVKLSDETNRSLWSIIDDSRMRIADDLDIAPDGRVFFSEATIRYDVEEWMLDALEGRGNGRIICYDPKDGSSRTILSNLQFPNGICVANDGHSFLYAETWGCRISRYHFAGPSVGKTEIIIPNLPGYPDNINRSSDGHYWCALAGMRSPAFDLAMKMPGLRRRMVHRVAPDYWLFPNMNTGCVIKFDLKGNIIDVLWDRDGLSHPMITSIREHKGVLYLGGVLNNRIGTYRIPGADPNWTAIQDYWSEH